MRTSITPGLSFLRRVTNDADEPANQRWTFSSIPLESSHFESPRMCNDLSASIQLTTDSQHVRLFATQYLAKLTRESPVAEEWQIRLILTQLYDTVPKVCECAVQVLEKICESTETLEIVVAMRPTLDHLGDMGAALFTRSVLLSSLRFISLR